MHKYILFHFFLLLALFLSVTTSLWAVLCPIPPLTSVSIYASPYAPFKYFPFFFAYFLYLDLYHLGSHLSGSGSGPGFWMSKFFGYLIYLLRFFGINISAPPLVSWITSLVFFSFFFSGIALSINYYRYSSLSRIYYGIGFWSFY